MFSLGFTILALEILRLLPLTKMEPIGIIEPVRMLLQTSEYSALFRT